MTQASETEAPTLTKNDRCDYRDCTAQAQARAHLLEGTLDFCGHHFTSIEEALTDQALSILDERINQ